MLHYIMLLLAHLYMQKKVLVWFQYAMQKVNVIAFSVHAVRHR